MKIKLFIFIFSLGIIFPSLSQHTHIQGKVINANNKLPVESITVTLLPINKTTLTDQNGHFTFNESKEQVKALVFSGFGYEKKTIIASDFIVGQTVTILPKNATTLDEVIVNSGSGTSQRNQISKLDIQMRGVTNSQEVLRIVPGRTASRRR